MSLPTLEILIASVQVRHGQLVRLLNHLEPQLAPFMGNARVIVNRDDAHAPVGQKRNQLLLAARADYVCFVDDDDRVHDDYVGRIMEALGSRPDYVGFKLAYSVDGWPQKPALHSLENRDWSETETAYLRGISHLNPIRRIWALEGLPFQPGFGEDKAWAERVAATGHVQTEVYISGDPMYFYDYQSHASMFSGYPQRHSGDAPQPLPVYTHVR